MLAVITSGETTMIRKLIMFAITSGLAKKAWDSYQGNRGVAASGRRGGSSRPVKPVIRAKAKRTDGPSSY
jgi:hypothetical protein